MRAPVTNATPRVNPGASAGPRDAATTASRDRGCLILDGAAGEGGGQMLRTALSLSLITGRPFRIERIRAGRARPGLMRQHLACVEGSAHIGSARLEGATLGSMELAFAPRTLAPGSYAFRIGSAGSVLLLLQTLLPPLLCAGGDSECLLEGGTHNPMAPPFPFVERAFLPAIRALGFDVEASLECPGFYPAGGGRVRLRVHPARHPRPLNLGGSQPAAGRRVHAEVWLAGLRDLVAEREFAALQSHVPLDAAHCRIVRCDRATGSGNTVHVIVDNEVHSEVFTGFGQPGVPAETVARAAALEALEYLASGATVGAHLADQLLLPMVLGAGGTFSTTRPSSHTLTNIDVIRQFLDVPISVTQAGEQLWKVEVKKEATP